MTLCYMDVCRWSDHFYMLGTMQIVPSSNIFWPSRQFGETFHPGEAFIISS